MRALLALGVLCAAATSIAADDVQRQLIQRERSHAELRLKMQQQQERTSDAPKTPSAGLERRTIERDQQQRFREFQERQMREEIAPVPAGDVHRDIDRQRAPQATAEELKRLERERELAIERSRARQ